MGTPEKSDAETIAPSRSADYFESGGGGLYDVPTHEA